MKKILIAATALSMIGAAASAATITSVSSNYRDIGTVVHPGSCSVIKNAFFKNVPTFSLKNIDTNEVVGWYSTGVVNNNQFVVVTCVD